MGSKAGAGSAVPCPRQKLQGQSLDLSFSRVASQRCSTKVQGKQEAEPPAWQQPLRAGWGQEQCQGESCEQLGAVGLLRAPWGFTWAPASAPCAPLHHTPQPHLELPREAPVLASCLSQLLLPSCSWSSAQTAHPQTQGKVFPPGKHSPHASSCLCWAAAAELGARTQPQH